MKTVLVTGARGQIGRGVLGLLAEDFSLKLLDLNAGNDPNCHQADLLDRSVLQAVMQGSDAVLHLAVAPGHSGTYENDAFNDVRLDVNVNGTYHVFDVAKQCQVKRVVLVSSAMVTWGHAQRNPQEKVAGDAPACPVGTYALTKALAEQVASYYATSTDTEVITVRITAPLDVSDPTWTDKPIRPQQIPFPDLAQAFSLALRVPLSGYTLVTVAGQSECCPWSLDAAKRVLGYRPQFDLDRFGLQFLDPFAVEEV